MPTQCLKVENKVFVEGDVSALHNNGACLWCSFGAWMFSTREAGANMSSDFPSSLQVVFDFELLPSHD